MVPTAFFLQQEEDLSPIIAHLSLNVLLDSFDFPNFNVSPKRSTLALSLRSNSSCLIQQEQEVDTWAMETKCPGSGSFSTS